MERTHVIADLPGRSCRLRFFAILLAALAIVPTALPAQPCPPADGAPGLAGEILSCEQSEPASLPSDGPALGIGNPVDLATGAKYERRVDIALADISRLPGAGGDLARVFALEPGLPFVFSRHFVGGPDDRGLGPGWRHGFDTRLAFRGGRRPRLQILQADGRRIRFERAADDRFVAERPAAGIVVALAGGGWQWRWPNGRRIGFDAGGRLVRIDSLNGDRLVLRYAAGQLAEVRDRGGRRMLLRWRAGRLVAVTVPEFGRVVFGFDTRGRLVSARVPDGGLERYWYEDPAGPHRLTGAGPVEGFRSRFAYDADGRVVRSLAAGEPATDELRLDYTVDANDEGGSTRVRGPRGEARYAWRRVGPARIARLVAASGTACRSCPPAGGWEWNARGWLVADGKLRYRHDDDGRLVAIEQAAGAAGLVDAAKEFPVETRRYRDAGAPLAAMPAELTRVSVAPGRRRSVRIDADAEGRIIAIDEAGFTPDGEAVARRIRLRHHPEGEGALAGRLAAIDRLDPDDPQRVLATVALRYDARGWLVGVEGPGDASRRIRRDAAGTPLPERIPRHAAKPATAGSFQGMSPAGFARSRASPDMLPATLVLSGHGERVRIDAAGRITREHYDDLGRLVRSEYPRVGTIRYEHDGLDRLAGIAWQDGTRWRFRRDAAGRPVKVLRARGDERVASRIGWRGEHAVRIDHPVQTSRAQYDAAGRLLMIEHRLLGGRHRQSFTYDPEGRLSTRRLPDGSRLRHEYDARGRPLALYWTPPGGVEQVLVDQARYGAGRIDSFRLGGRTIQRRTFGVDGRLAMLVWSGHPRYPRWRFSWRGDGRLAGIDSATDSRRFAWDRRGRLLVDQRHADGGARSVEYFAWGPAGDPLGHRDLDGRTRRIAAAGAPATAGLSIRHRGMRLDYGPERRIRSAAAGGRVLARYRYNALGERAVREADGERHGYLYHRRQLFAETDGAGRLRRTWLHWQGRVIGFLDHAPDAAPRLHFVLGDHLGTPAMITDAGGEPVWSGRISAFGSLVSERGALRQPLRLPGQVADAETGFSDNYQRSYDPLSFRYLEPDPLGVAGGGDAYAYAAGDPVAGADPLGLVLFAFDGTGNTPASLTNVWLMSRQYDSYDEYDRQAQIDELSFYVPGVGTTGGMRDNAVVGGALAIELQARIDLQLERLDAYVRERLGYYLDAGATIGPGSPLQFDIDIVGFSRGAAAARDFANRVLRRRDNGYYRELVDGGCVSIDIRFLGLFDTVLSTHVGNFELGIPEAVGHAASLIAANEHRRAFPLESIFGSADARGLASNRVEVSLLGAHADVGGGYACIDPAACDGGDLSDIALLWMREQAAAQGVAFLPLPPEHRRIDVPVLHDETSSFLFYDPDPAADREVRYHAASRTHPLTEDLPHEPAAPAQPSRESIAEGMSAGRVAEFVVPDAVPRPGRVGEVDLVAYARWLREELGLAIETGADGGAGGSLDDGGDEPADAQTAPRDDIS